MGNPANLPPGANPLLDHPWTEPPALADAIEVAPGVLWLRMALPFTLNHINLWVLEDHDGWVMVDTGFNDEATRGAWESLWRGRLGGRPIRGLICTHFHPDHMGLAGWLVDRLGIDMATSLGEWAFARMLTLDSDERFNHRAEAFYRRSGMGEAEITAILSRGNPYKAQVVPTPEQYSRLVDGDIMAIGGNAWRVIVGRGHSPEHAALYCDSLGVMIAGDMVLPRISPNVAVWPQEPEGDPLSLFLSSLARMRDEAPDDTLVLPSHGLPFHGLHRRIDQLLAHHEERLEATMAAAASPATATAIAGVLFPRATGWHDRMFAVGEGLAHLHHMRAQGRIESWVDEDGAVLFQARP